jgi:hypothetical protein
MNLPGHAPSALLLQNEFAIAGEAKPVNLRTVLNQQLAAPLKQFLGTNQALRAGLRGLVFASWDLILHGSSGRTIGEEVKTPRPRILNDTKSHYNPSACATAIFKLPIRRNIPQIGLTASPRPVTCRLLIFDINSRAS